MTFESSSDGTKKAMGIEYLVENVGKTPANNVRIYRNVVVVPQGSQPDFRYPHKSVDTRGTLDPYFPGFPLSTISLAVWDERTKKNAFFTDSEQQEILDGVKKRVFFYARAEYSDIFGVRHWNQFCGETTGHTLIWQIPKCAAYNRTDSNQVLETPFAPPSAVSAPQDIVCKKVEP